MSKDLQTALVSLIYQPIKRQERLDGLIKQVFTLKTKYKYKTEIVSVFQLIGPRIHQLSNLSVETIMRLMYYLEIDADPRPPSESTSDDIIDSGHTVEDRDNKWNDEIGNFLMKKLREASVALGYDVKDSSPGDLMHQSQAINAYLQTERIELDKEIASPTSHKQLTESLTK